jgi:hypothetical protein
MAVLIGTVASCLLFTLIGVMIGWWKGYCYGKALTINYHVQNLEKLIVNGNMEYTIAAQNTKESTAHLTTAKGCNAQSSAATV